MELITALFGLALTFFLFYQCATFNHKIADKIFSPKAFAKHGGLIGAIGIILAAIEVAAIYCILSFIIDAF